MVDAQMSLFSHVGRVETHWRGERVAAGAGGRGEVLMLLGCFGQVASTLLLLLPRSD